MLIRHAALFLFALATGMASKPSLAQQVSTSGDCSPVISEVTGNVSVVCNLGGPSGPKFSVSYYRVSGIGLSFLLDGKLSPDWEKRLGGQQAIVRNDVSKEARRFIDRFATPITGTYLFGQAGSNEDVSENLADYVKTIDPTVQTIEGEYSEFVELDPEKWRAYYGGGRTGALFIPDTRAAETLFATDRWPQGYNAIYNDLTGDGMSLLQAEGKLRPPPMMWRWLTEDDLDQFESGYAEYVRRVLTQAVPTAGGTPIDVAGHESFEEVVTSHHSRALMKGIDSVRYLTREGMPDRFMMVQGDLGAHYGWAFTSTPRDFQMLVAVMENTGPSAIEIGEFELRATKAMNIRTATQSLALLDASPARQQRVFPIGVLKPGEKILIPVRIELALSDFYVDRQEELDDLAFHGRSAQRALAAIGNRSITAIDYNSVGLFTKPASSFPSQTVPEVVERFEYGPAWRIDTVVVNGQTMGFRQHDPNNFMILAGAEVGSCPFAFSYQPDSDLWLNEGHFLLGATAPDLKRTEDKPLPNFKGRVMVRELEHEIAMLDMIHLKLTDADGVETVFKPINPALRDEDGVELRLAYGEGVELDFGLTEDDWRGKQASLVAAGYYINFAAPELFASGN